MTHRVGRRGVALMLVLWVLVVLGTIAAGVSALVRAESRAVANARARSQARYAAESGVLAATDELRRLLRQAVTPRQQALLLPELEQQLTGLGEQAIGSARFQVAAADLSARLDLNAADAGTLVGFLEQFMGAREAESLADALEDWKDGDDLERPRGAEAPEYARRSAPFTPANRPLSRLDELTRVIGFTDSLTRVLAPYVTVHGDGRVNVNTAPRPVLAAVPGLGPAGADAVLSAREQGQVFESPAAVWSLLRHVGQAWGAVSISQLWVRSRRVLLVSRGWVAGHPLTHEIQAVYEVDGARVVLRSWVERDL